jgi:hypothetical protein
VHLHCTHCSSQASLSTPLLCNAICAANLIAVPSATFRQKIVYAYPAHLNLNKASFDMDCEGTQADPRFGSFFQVNVGARFAIHFLLEFADFEIVSFPGRVTDCSSSWRS